MDSASSFPAFRDAPAKLGNPVRGNDELEIVSVGDGRLLDNGERSPMQVKEGDRVIFSSYAGETFKVGDDELLLMREDDILAVIDD